MSFLSNIFGGTRTDVHELIQNGARIIDVRTRDEFREGHFKGSINIPLDQLEQKANSLKKDEVLVMCCRSGMRSGSATAKLKSIGFTNVFIGGSWTSL